MSKKLLKSLSILAVVAVFIIGGTISYFSDTETSIDNKFVAGKFNLLVGSQCSYNGETQLPCNWLKKDLANELFFNFDDIKPGDSGENTITLRVDNNDAWICAELANLVSDDNGCDSPENKVDTTCGAGQGELQDNLYFTIWKDNGAGNNACNNILDADEAAILNDQPAASNLWPIADSTTGAPIQGDTDYCLGVAWNVPIETSNIIQTDSLVGDVKFTAVQARNMANFKCSDLTDNGVSDGCSSNSECNDGIYCNGLEICNAQNVCESPGNPCPGQNVGPNCNDSCNEASDDCTANDANGSSCAGGLCQNGTCDTSCIPSVEVCDGQDNDCNGQTDEGLATPTSCGIGSCYSTGSNICINGQYFNMCVPGIPGTEICGDGIDQDCNGSDLACSECSTTADCVDGNPCTTDTCLVGACTHSPITGNMPTDAESIQMCFYLGTCNAGVPSCNPNPITGGTCDDGNLCTIDTGIYPSCVHTVNTCDDGNSGTIDGCNSATGVCDHFSIGFNWPPSFHFCSWGICY